MAQIQQKIERRIWETFYFCQKMVSVHEPALVVLLVEDTPCVTSRCTDPESVQGTRMEEQERPWRQAADRASSHRLGN